MNSQTVDNPSTNLHEAQKEFTFESDVLATSSFGKLKKGKKTITFMGFSGAEYEQKDLISKKVFDILEMYDPNKYIINAGATIDGIGMVYPLAKSLGFETTGIVSTEAQKYDVSIAEEVYHVFFIEDDTGGGLIEGTDELSPTSQVMVAVSDIIYALGGGAVSRDEYMKAQEAGKEVHFIAADVNHAKAIKKAKNKNQEVPTDFRGELEKSLESLK